MSVLRKDLHPANNVTVTAYFPARTNSKEGAYDWGVAQGIVIRNLYRKMVTRKVMEPEKDAEGNKIDVSLERFRNKCRGDFEQRLDELELWEYLQVMYFDNGAFFDIAPECLLFKLTSLSGNSPKHNLGNLFASLMDGKHITEPVRADRNFLEQQIVDSLRSPEVLEDFGPTTTRKQRLISTGVNEAPYLPFLSECFTKDLMVLAEHPRYLISKLEDFLKLYGYLYTSQLALNIKGWRNEPSSKPVYFMLEGESASLERELLVNSGHQNVAKQLGNLFPYLSILETLQSPDKEANERMRPLWDLAKRLVDDDAEALKNYAEAFAANRFGPDFEFPHEDGECSAEHWLDFLLKHSVKQFDKGQTRAAAQGRYVREIEQELCSSFVKSRGRIGKVLLINQDYLSLITNIVIPKEGKLRFHELIDEFCARGIYLDKQSQKALIRFYERMGNVERMSDSGDAVYVRSTI